MTNINVAWKCARFKFRMLFLIVARKEWTDSQTFFIPPKIKEEKTVSYPHDALRATNQYCSIVRLIQVTQVIKLFMIFAASHESMRLNNGYLRKIRRFSTYVHTYVSIGIIIFVVIIYESNWIYKFMTVNWMFRHTLKCCRVRFEVRVFRKRKKERISKRSE